MLQKNFKLKFFIIKFLIFSIFSQCVGSLTKEYPQKRYYLITVEEQNFKKSRKKFPYLRVNKFKISNLYEGKNFIYKLSDVRYEADFYSEFLVFPASNITEIFQQWILKTEIGTLPPPTLFENEKLYTLSGQILSLYGNFIDSNNPGAVMELDIYIQRSSDSGVIFKKSYRQIIKIPNTQADELVKGWNQAITNILLELESDLKKVEAL